MHKNSVFLQRIIIFVLLTSCVVSTSAGEDDLWFFVLVKSNNYSQSQDGQLTLLNYHFFSELFGKEEGNIKSATLTRVGTNDAAEVFEDRGDTFYYEGGHFNTLDAVDEGHPNGEYRFRITLASGETIDTSLSLAGPGDETDIPSPVHIYFFQHDKEVSPRAIDPEKPMTVKWSPYSNGEAGENGIVDDMIFVVFQNCRGERVFHTGLPFKEMNYLKYDATSVTVPANRFKPGQTYSMFVEFPHVVDSKIVNGVPGFASYATATYLDINTSGERNEATCPEKIPPLDTGQTDRMDVEIN